MAITYDGGSGLFDKLGPLVASQNIFETFETGTLATKLGNILAVIETATPYDDQARVAYHALKDELNRLMDGNKQDIVSLVSPILTQELDEAENFYSADIASQLKYLIFCMLRDSETVKQNAITVTGPSAGTPTPTGNHTVVASQYASTASGADSSSRVNSILKSNNFNIVCVNNATSGAERFEVRGNLPRVQRVDPAWENVGLAGQLTAISSVGDSMIGAAGGFEKLNGSNFSGWSIAAGTWSTNIRQVTGAGNFYRGAAAAQLDAVAANPSLLFSGFSAGILKPYTKYLISFKAKKASSSDGTLNVGFTGTANLFSTKTVSSGLTTSWAIYSYIFNTGADPSDIANFYITLTGGTTGSVYIDEVCLTQMKTFGGTGIAVISGNTDAAIDDVWTLTMANNKAGQFATFFGRWFDTLLPASGSPSIADSLADPA